MKISNLQEQENLGSCGLLLYHKVWCTFFLDDSTYNIRVCGNGNGNSNLLYSNLNIARGFMTHQTQYYK